MNSLPSRSSSVRSRFRSPAAACLAYAWAAPYTVMGVFGGAAVLALGGQCRMVTGTIEVYGGLFGRLFAGTVRRPRHGALTLGHVILGTDSAAMVRMRAHDRVHVRQYECWGPLFLPAYALSSAGQLLHGRRGYRDNHFERQAFALETKKGGGGG